MVRVIIKGGVWRNTEDEVLKAAVMKYGKNQWSRVASLLHRKSAKQCKARWFEWLDPSIKKTEWSREEDEKLLHLSKLMPTQWRTIAPIVGRTASQCLERYEYLLDRAVSKADGLVEEADDPRKLRPGEIDPCPETKPARPDPIDMDEDELEMLSEARARLANTQGKKAKRKARERQLEEARRLASLQKRRELRAAGIAWGRGHLFKRGIDYNEEIPFQRHPLPGFHDPSEDKVLTDMNTKRISQKLEEKRKNREAATAEEKRKGRERQKKRKTEGLTDAMFAKLQKEKKRSKLVLPEPQITDTELESIVKLGKANETIRDLALLNENGATSALLPDFSSTPNVDELRTPMLAIEGQDAIMLEAENLLKLQNVETPLKGGLNPVLPESPFGGVTPRREPIQTPNTLLRATLTPRTTSGRTPLFSTPYLKSTSDAENIVSDKIALSVDRNQRALREELRSGFMTLPPPKNDFEIIPPEMDMSESPNDLTSSSDSHALVADADDLQKQKEAELKKQHKEKLKMQTKAVQRNLPRPHEINTSVLRKEITAFLSGPHAADEMLKREMLVLLHHDALNNPTPAQTKYMNVTDAADRFSQFLEKNPYIPANQTDLIEANKLLEAEEVTIFTELNRDHLDLETYSQIWNECYSQVAFLPSQLRYTRAAMMTKKERLDSLQFELENNTTRAVQELNSLFEQIDLASMEHAAFAHLEKQEDIAIAHRLRTLSSDVQRQEARERDLQKAYALIKEKLESLKLKKQQEDASVSAKPVLYSQV
ncbi:cell division cycle 5 protein like [Trichuris trichiura]|uniref:Cell division cycle 5 protein like n=1 Tax=Trichuris trichiura TaxID=36087 RepID=A0A077ZEA2_TRITR|nr:cell division cycle 5 protein like [Trichuris trichiura]